MRIQPPVNRRYVRSLLNGKSKQTRFGRHRRGIAVVMVLGLLAITLALSYSMLRGQVMTAQLQQNFERTVDARYAALAGMNAALRKMHESSWAGVDEPVHGKIDDHTGYDITYTTGDASLTSASPDWNEYPFRVTVRVVGYAENPDQPAMKSTHTLETVVQLVRRALNADPSGWNNIQPYALYQWSTDDQQLNPPFRIEGNALMLGSLELAQSYPPSSQRSRYFSDLNAMRSAGLGDHRPFGGGTLTLNYSRQPSGVMTSLQSQLGVATQNTNASSSQPVAPPSTVTSYQLYPGGKSYDIPSLQRTYGLVMHSTTAQPDPVSNPLGVFRSESWMTFGNNAKIVGTLLSPGSSSDLSVFGTGVEFQGYNLPALEGSSQVKQLPALLVRDDFVMYDGTGTTIRGLAVVWDQLSVGNGSVSTQLNLTGKLVTSSLKIGERDEWGNLSNGNWVSSLNNFLGQVLNVTGIKYYPQYLHQRNGLAYQPQLNIKQSTDGTQYHWQDWSQPIYVKGATDTGLRWHVKSQRTVAE